MTLNLTLNQNLSYSSSHWKILPTSLLHKKRRVQLRFSKEAKSGQKTQVLQELDFPAEYHSTQWKTWQNLLGVGVAQGRSCQACLEFCTWHGTPFSFWILSWKEIFLDDIIGSTSTGKILTCLLMSPIFILNLCLLLKAVPKHRHYFSKIGESKSHCLITTELRKKDTSD